MTWTVEVLTRPWGRSSNSSRRISGPLSSNCGTESHGLERVREPNVKHLEGPLWEMRLRGGGIARAVYVTATRRRVVVVPVFGKKTERTPRREIELALKRAKEVT